MDLIHEICYRLGLNDQYWIVRNRIDKAVAKAFPYRLVMPRHGGSKWSYSDPREVMLHAIGQSVVNQVEDSWFNHIDWTSTPEHLKAYHVTMKVYYWYTRRRPQRYSPLEYYKTPEEYENQDDPLAMRNDPEFAKVCMLEEIYEKMYYEEDQQMLRDILEVRDALWT